MAGHVRLNCIIKRRIKLWHILDAAVSVGGTLPNTFSASGLCTCSTTLETAHNNFIYGGASLSGSGIVNIGDCRYKYTITGGAYREDNGYRLESTGSVIVKFEKIN